MSDIKIKEEATAKGGRYVARIEGSEAELTFHAAGTRARVIDHVGVPAALEGRGVGAALVHHAVTEARAGGFRIVPKCPFATALFRRHKDWHDVLAEGGEPV